MQKTLYKKFIPHLKRLIKEPAYYFRIAKALLRGSFYIIYYRFLRRNVKIDFPFFAYAKLKIIGPGLVTIGKECRVFENVFRGLTIVTLAEKASVAIGQGCSLGGLTIRCYECVQIGDNAMTANSLIQDFLFVDLCETEINVTRNYIVAPPKPIVLGDNVWLGGHACVLSGSKIGNNCVLAAGSLSFDIKLKDYSLGSGNPIKRAFPITQLLALRK